MSEIVTVYESYFDPDADMWREGAGQQMVRQCEACAEGRHCERLQALMHAAWRHGETDE